MFPLIVAHRGAMVEAPENTLTALSKAVSYRVDGIEFDVQISKDDIPVLFHDDSLVKINGSLKSISEYSFQDLKSLDWGSWFSKEFSNEKIPTLEQVLKIFGAKTSLYIEIKPPPDHEAKELYYRLAGLVVEQVHNLISRDMIDNIFILSFDPEILKTCFINDSGLHYILNLYKPFIDDQKINIDTKILYGYCIEDKDLNQDFVAYCRHYDKKILTYSCNSREAVDRAIGFGVDVIMTDDPGNSLWNHY